MPIRSREMGNHFLASGVEKSRKVMTPVLLRVWMVRMQTMLWNVQIS
jgi:hypothetical protein